MLHFFLFSFSSFFYSLCVFFFFLLYFISSLVSFSEQLSSLIYSFLFLAVQPRGGLRQRETAAWLNWEERNDGLGGWCGFGLGIPTWVQGESTAARWSFPSWVLEIGRLGHGEDWAVTHGAGWCGVGDGQAVRMPAGRVSF